MGREWRAIVVFSLNNLLITERKIQGLRIRQARGSWRDTHISQEPPSPLLNGLLDMKKVVIRNRFWQQRRCLTTHWNGRAVSEPLMLGLRLFAASARHSIRALCGYAT